MNLYAVRPGELEAEEVLRDGWSHLELARELWSLVDERRFRDLDELLARVEGRSAIEVRFVGADLAEAVRLMNGLEAAMVGKIVDERHFLPAEGLDGLARWAPWLDLGEHRPLGDRRQAVAEALVKVALVRDFFDRARASNRDVVGG